MSEGNEVPDLLMALIRFAKLAYILALRRQIEVARSELAIGFTRILFDVRERMVEIFVLSPAAVRFDLKARVWEEIDLVSASSASTLLRGW